jgi:hypothetical protein
MKFFWKRLPLSLKDEIATNKFGMYELWCKRKSSGQEPFEEITVPIASGGRTYKVSFTVEGESLGTHDERIVELWVLHIY